MKKRIVLFTTCMLLIACVVTVLISTGSFRNTYTNDMSAVLQGNINAMSLTVGDDSGDYQGIADAYQKAYRQNNRITFIAEDGTVLADAPAGNETLDNHLQRPEVQQALKGGFGVSVRRSDTLGYDMIYVAKQLPNGVILRDAMPLANAAAMINRTLPVIIMFMIALVVVVVIFSGKFAKSILQPFGQLHDSVQDYIDGGSKVLKMESKYPEFDDITQAFANLSRRLNRYIEKVKRENNKTALILDNIDEGLLILDENYKVLLINSAAKNILGVREEVENENILHCIRRQDVVKRLEKSLGQKKNLQFEVRETLNGKVYGFYTSVIPDMSFVSGMAGDGMLVLIRDVTEIERSERIRRDFAANVSHELKTPLTSINGFAQLIENDMVNDRQSIMNYAKRITEESERLMGLINDTLQLSELEQISFDENIETIDVAQQASEVLRLLENKMKEHGICAHLEGKAFIRANRRRIRQLLMNLCDNAVKYGKEGGNLWVNLSEDTKTITISIKDDGIGIPEEEIERIFERFYRAKNSGGATISGTGLGLAIVKHIVSLYDGVLSVLSEQGDGSTFTVILRKE
ncbi:MAG: ATP-binding protein [Christensenella sp.]|nr:ATP-binding protein [Christensenella sp.]